MTVCAALGSVTGGQEPPPGPDGSTALERPLRPGGPRNFSGDGRPLGGERGGRGGALHSPRGQFPGSGGEPMHVVEQFLEMPPERLAMIRTLIERLEQMTPEEREAMRERLAEYRAMSEERRSRMKEAFRQVPIEERLLLRMYWRSLPKKEAQAAREKMKQLSPDERELYRQEMVSRAREAGISIMPPGPPPDIEVPPPPELLPPPFPDHLKRPPKMPTSSELQ